MRSIALAGGILFAIVDDADFETLSGYAWHAHRSEKLIYARTTLRCSGPNRHVYMHRMIFGAANGQRVDHRDGDGLHNWRDNLRTASSSQNQANSRDRIRTTTPYRGVKICRGRFQGGISHNGVKLHAGTFDTAEEAARARDALAIEHHGEFARLNFPPPA